LLLVSSIQRDAGISGLLPPPSAAEQDHFL
jgi:hypothetical protein